MSSADNLMQTVLSQNVGHDLDTIRLIPWWYSWKSFSKKLILKIQQMTKNMKNYPVGKELRIYPCTGPKVTKLFSCSTQLSMQFQLFINTKIPTNKEVSCFKPLRCGIYHANIYEQDKFHAQLSWVCFITSRPGWLLWFYLVCGRALFCMLYWRL